MNIARCYSTSCACVISVRLPNEAHLWHTKSSTWASDLCGSWREEQEEQRVGKVEGQNEDYFFRALSQLYLLIYYPFLLLFLLILPALSSAHLF